MDPVPAKTFDYDPDDMILNLFYEDKDDRWFPGAVCCSANRA
jgi:hypothetical protein